MNQETPVLTRSCYTSSGFAPEMIWNPAPFPEQEDALDRAAAILNVGELMRRQQAQQFHQPTEESTNMPEPKPTRRIVQVFIADPNENVPLEESVLFKGDQKLTDLTDTELFFEVPIADILKAHNEKRVRVVDREASKRAGKDVFLDPVRIRELRMVVTTVAQF